MAVGDGVYNSVQLDSIEAAQVAQLFEETRLRSHQDHPFSGVGALRNAHRDDMMSMLEAVFDDQRQVEFAFMLMAEGYRLGSK